MIRRLALQTQRFLLPVLLAFLGVGVAGAGCKPNNASGADAGESATPGSLTPEQASKVLAQVGDKTITLGEYAAALEHMDQFDRMRYQSPERRKELLNEMINVEVLAQEARDKGYDKDPRTQQEIRAVLRDALFKEARKDAPKPQDISDEDVKAYYDAHRAEYRDPERRRVSAVVLPSESAANAVIEQAKGILSAAQWGELVRAKSVDPSAKANVPADLAGDLGMVAPPDDNKGSNPRVPDAVRAAVFQIDKVGDVYPHAVRGGDGKFYVVRLTVKNEPTDRSLKESERSIRVKMSQDGLRSKEDALLAQLRTKYPVQIDDNAVATVNVDLFDAGTGTAAVVDAATDGP